VPLYWIDDVQPGEPLWKDVQFAAATGLMGGPELGTLHFLPAATLTRAQAAAAVAKALGTPVVAPRGQFGDVPATHWAAGGNFTPNAPVTSEQMRAMIGRALGDEIANKSVPASSSDAGAMSRGKAAQALTRAYRARIRLP